MKRPFSLFALIALSATILQAATYDIYLNNSERYENCTIVYESSSTTKFRFKDKSGKEVTKEIPTSSILHKSENKVEQPATPQPAEQAAATPEQPAAQEGKEGESKPAEGEAAAKEGEQPAATPPQEEPTPDGNLKKAEGSEIAKDATLRLREKLTLIDKEMATLTKPSNVLVSISKSTKSRVENQLGNLDALALEVAQLQEKFNTAGAADYRFTCDDRDKYARDGSAAYKAMLIDMKERKGRRKVGGLDKFEIMRERYQGVPEYIDAYKWYLKTLKALEKKWRRMHTAEANKRKKLMPARRQALTDADTKEFDKLREHFKKNNEDIAKVWYTPSPRNEKMLFNCINKVEDALRRNSNEKHDKYVGTVPQVQERFWKLMDDTRQLMINGDLDGAEAKLKDDAPYKEILRLNTMLLPNEYRQPMVDEYRNMTNEIRARQREYQITKRNLESKTRSLDRAIANAEAQINNVLIKIEEERDMQAEITAEQEEEAAKAAAKEAAKAAAKESKPKNKKPAKK